MTVHIDPACSVDELRTELYSGNFVVLTRLRAVRRFVEHTRRELTQLFSPHDPERAHDHFTPEGLASVVGPWKPKFIHDPNSGRLVRAIIEEAGFDGGTTYVEVPKPRTSFPQGHLNAGAAFAFPWHRDVWYSAPPQQINWWLPVFPVREDNAMGFDPQSFGRPVANDSRLFDYYENNVARRTSGAQVDREVQVRPQALHHQVESELVVLPSPGSILLFSGAQLHRSIPNASGRARFSVDFRTVDTCDLSDNRGAPVVDADCSGTAIREFRRVADDRPFDECLVAELFGPPPEGAMLVFGPNDSAGVTTPGVTTPGVTTPR